MDGMDVEIMRLWTRQIASERLLLALCAAHPEPQQVQAQFQARIGKAGDLLSAKLPAEVCEPELDRFCSDAYAALKR